LEVRTSDLPGPLVGAAGLEERRISVPTIGVRAAAALMADD
jgi:hypothetical protein